MHSYLSYLPFVSLGIVVTLLTIIFLKRLAPNLGLVDYPGGRKTHHEPTPLVGGIAIYLGLCCSLFLLPVPNQMFYDLFVGASIVLVVGVFDDRFDISARFRLVFQLIAAFMVIFWGGHYVNYLGSLFYVPNLYLGALAIPVTVILMIGFINAINMLDGQDGLAGGVVLTEALLLFILSVYTNQMVVALVLLTFGILVGTFLFFNYPSSRRSHASIFLGDSGSNFAAFVIAWAVICLSQTELPFAKPMTLIWIVAFPLFDMTSACFIRLSRGQSITMAGHDHVHHLLRAMHYSRQHSTLLIIAFSLGLGLLGLLLTSLDVSEGAQSILFVLLFAAYVGLMAKLRQAIDLQHSNVHQSIRQGRA